MTALTKAQLKAKLGAVDLVEWQKDIADSAWLLDDLPEASTAEMEAGTETDPRAMSPADIAAAIAALAGGDPGYLEYLVLLPQQTGTSAPVPTVLVNTLGGVPVWSRVQTGVYRATLNGAFPANKVALMVSPLPIGDHVFAKRESDNVIRVETSSYDGTPGDELLGEDGPTTLWVRVYP